MKFLILIGLLMSQKLFSSEVIESAPLSLENDGTRKIIVRDQEKESAIAPAPIDGQLKLDSPIISPSNSPANSLATPPENGAPSQVNDIHKSETISNEINPVEEKKEFKENYFLSSKKYIQIGYGYVNSRYEKIESTLDNGSTVDSLRFLVDLNAHFQSGFGIEILSDTSGESIPDNIRAIQYRLFGVYHRPLMKNFLHIEGLVGFGLSLGDYGVRRRYINGQGLEVTVKLNQGTLVGVVPEMGLRIPFMANHSFDLLVEYHQYFGSTQKNLGGLGFSPRVNFSF